MIILAEDFSSSAIVISIKFITISMSNIRKINKINEVGNRVFLDPTPLLTYEELVQRSLGSNTYRGFHKVKKDSSGAACAFRSVLLRDKNFIINKIKNAKSRNNINDLVKEVCRRLHLELSENIREDQLASFNKIRKPMDIVIQHMVAMGEDFTKERGRLTKWLYLPLDSQMFQSDFVFSDAEAKSLNIKRNFTFRSIECENNYMEIQDFLEKKSKNIGLNHRIYFDLIWNDRYKSSGTNLFLTNPR